jgi:hypothetical protein
VTERKSGQGYVNRGEKSKVRRKGKTDLTQGTQGEKEEKRKR